MSKLSRNAESDKIIATRRTFFVTTKCAGGRQLLQTDRNAYLLIDVLRTNVAAARFKVHDFVVMPDHVHLLISVEEETTIEKAVQYIKGVFSYRLKKEFGYLGEVWQRGFADERVLSRGRYLALGKYIALNPVRRGLVDSAEDYPFTFEFLVRRKAAGAKAPKDRAVASGTTEVVPFQNSADREFFSKLFRRARSKQRRSASFSAICEVVSNNRKIGLDRYPVSD